MVSSFDVRQLPPTLLSLKIRFQFDVASATQLTRLEKLTFHDRWSLPAAASANWILVETHTSQISAAACGCLFDVTNAWTQCVHMGDMYLQSVTH